MEDQKERDLISAVQKALRELPSNMRHCVVLYVQGRNYAEIAVVLKLPVNTVKSNIQEARKRLKETLGDQFDGFGR